jgi:integrase
MHSFSNGSSSYAANAERVRSHLALGRLDRLSDRDLEDLAIEWFADLQPERPAAPDVDEDDVIDAISDEEANLRLLTDGREHVSAGWVSGVTDRLLLDAGAKFSRPKSSILRAKRLEIDRASPQYAYLQRLIKRGLMITSARTLSRLDGRPLQHVDDIFSAKKTDRGTSTKYLSVDDAIRKFETDPGRGGTAKTRLDYSMVFKLLRECIDPSQPVDTLSRDHCEVFRATLITLPPNATKRFPSRRLRDISAEAKSNVIPPLNPQTINSHLNKLSTFLNWCTRERLSSSNEANGLRVDEPSSSRKRRTPFDDDQLIRIFTAPLFNGCENDGTGYARPGTQRPRRARFWVPLISLFHGMRLNEICQLKVSDIIERHGYQAFDINDIGSDRRVKTSAGRRIVPLHPFFQGFGFSEFVLAVVKSGGDRLFPELTRDHRGYYSDAFQKWFSRFLSSCGAHRSGTTFHSFRHGWADRLREAGVPEERRRALGGWQAPGQEPGYGLGHPIQVLAADIALLNYPKLDLSHLHRPKDAIECGDLW